MAPTRSSPYVWRLLRSTRKMTSFLGYIRISATFELRAGVVKTRRPHSGSSVSEEP